MAVEWTVSDWKRCFLWTFTFREVVGPEEIGSVWNVMQGRLKRAFGASWRGIRVFEVHPGGHGCHCHCLVPDYIPARLVWAVVGEDFGRPDVRRVTGAKGAHYMCKYLGKYRYAKEHRLPRGSRVWASFGKLESKVRVCDVECRSAVGLVYAFLKLHGFNTLGLLGIQCPESTWGILRMVRRLIDHPEKWPVTFPPSLVKELFELIPTARADVQRGVLDRIELFDQGLPLAPVNWWEREPLRYRDKPDSV